MNSEVTDIVDQIMAELRSQPPTRHDYYATNSEHRMDCRLCKYEYEQEQQAGDRQAEEMTQRMQEESDLERLRAMEEERGT